MLRARLSLLGVSGPEQDGVIEEALIRVLRSQHVGLPLGVALFGTAVRVVSTHRRERLAASNIADSATLDGRKVGRVDEEKVLVALRKVPFRLRAVLVGVDLAQFPISDVSLVLGTSLSETEASLLEARSAFANALRHGG